MARDFEDSTLWRISAFERMRLETGHSGFARLEGKSTMFSDSFEVELRHLQADPSRDDVLEVVAACMRRRESALLCLQHEELVWPVTLFPAEALYHAPRDFATASREGLATLRLVTAEPPGVRPPGHWMHERVAQVEHYRPIGPLVWAIALYGPRRMLLAEIGGRAAYRLIARPMDELQLPGALQSAAERLHRETASLQQIAAWPGMSLERASRLLNGLYLGSSLLVTRTHPAARAEPSESRGLFASLLRRS